jgi:N-sulphoglucosamine sulphohydrolase, C-terminal
LISRRSLLLTPLLLAAQTRRKAAVLLFGETLPPGVSEHCVIFPRAYACCPQPEPALRALEAGRFPHAIHGADFKNLLPAPPDNPVEVEEILAGRRRDTVLVFTMPCGDGRDTPFEPSVKVPLAICAPGLLEPRAASEILISTADLAPTLLGLCGLPVPDTVQGRDLSELLVKGKGDLPDSVYIEGGLGTKTEWRAVIRGYDKLVMDLDGTVTHLYNLAEDPEEQFDLVGDTSSLVNRDGLVALVEVWRRRLRDGMDASGLILRR